MPTRKNHSPVFKAKAALGAIREEMSMALLSKKHGVHPTQIGTCKRAAIENMATAFARRGSTLEQVSIANVDKLNSKIGPLVVERDFLAPSRACKHALPDSGCLTATARGAKKKMLSKDYKLSVRRHCKLPTLT